MGKTCKAYEVVRFDTPKHDRDLNVLINTHVRRVREWAAHMGEVRVVSFSEQRSRGVLTIEYTAHDTSKDDSGN